ncbi:YraN family protein [Massilia niastensis]|uniref:YraN family protein n=1 Tax=Massilia niastensis TaxID=544911 RepID=UPI000375236C|nr:YraN family protein [Massilia niastensis]
MWPGRLSPRQVQGHDWEQKALAYLKRQRLSLLTENFRTKGGEIDLVMLDGSTLVFVEVRQRADDLHGGAAASITPAKIRRLVCAAQAYLLRYPVTPPCRFDVIAIEGGRIEWLRNVIEL